MPEKVQMNKSAKKSVVFILSGPTSSGKTSMALQLCKDFNGDIISFDSRQVCKFMDIGTGKVPVNSAYKIQKGDGCWEFDGVKIWGYDLVNPDQYFSGYDFAKYALEKITEILKEGKNVFLVGGTGFYIDLFTGKIKPSKVLPDLKLRDSLENLSLSDLQNKLKKLDEKAFQKIDQKNKVRLIRAIEKELSMEVREETLPYLENVTLVHLGLAGPRAFFYQRADRWVEEIWKNGLVEEVKALVKMGYGRSPKVRGLVYKQVLGFLEESVSEKETIEKIKFDIHAYIRRQQTWFKKNSEIYWVDVYKDDFKEIIYNKVKENL